MQTSDASWSGSLRVIGELERPDHHFLGPGDECYFMGSYTSGTGFGHSFANNLISNLKKPMSTIGTGQWKYKVGAIRDAGEALRANLNPNAIKSSAFIPVPPSCPKDSADHDDRILKIANIIAPDGDVRELLFTQQKRTARHTTSSKRSLDELRLTIGAHPALRSPRPSQVILLDDVLTTGCSFVVRKEKVLAVWPGIKVYGVFVARVARPTVDFDFGLSAG